MFSLRQVERHIQLAVSLRVERKLKEELETVFLQDMEMPNKKKH